MREETLRATAGLKRALSLSSWRGRSGRRYVVGVHALTEAEVLEAANAILIAVRRGLTGAEVVATLAAAPGTGEAARRSWLAAARLRGATELHIHRLAETDGERRAAAEDLAGEEA